MINRAGLLHCSERKEKHRTENGCNMGTFKTENNCALADCRGHSGIVYPKKKEERLFKVMTVAESRLSITTVQKKAGQSEASVLANSLEREKKMAGGSGFNGPFP